MDKHLIQAAGEGLQGHELAIPPVALCNRNRGILLTLFKPAADRPPS